MIYNKTKLVYTDADSYVIKVETGDLYEDFKEINVLYTRISVVIHKSIQTKNK